MAKRPDGVETAIGYLLAGGIVYLLYRAFAPKVPAQTSQAAPGGAVSGPVDSEDMRPKQDLWEAPPATSTPPPEMPPEEAPEGEEKEAEVVNPFPPPKKHRRHPEMDGSFPAGNEDDLLGDDNPDIL